MAPASVMDTDLTEEQQLELALKMSMGEAAAATPLAEEREGGEVIRWV